MQTRTLGSTGPTVSALGLGAMGMSSGAYGAANRAESIATVHAALESGVTLIDTGDFYAMATTSCCSARPCVAGTGTATC